MKIEYFCFSSKSWRFLRTTKVVVLVLENKILMDKKLRLEITASKRGKKTNPNSVILVRIHSK